MNLTVLEALLTDMDQLALALGPYGNGDIGKSWKRRRPTCKAVGPPDLTGLPDGISGSDDLLGRQVPLRSIDKRT